MLPAMRMTGATLLGLVLALALTSRVAERNYRFDSKRLRGHDPNGWLEMPGSRTLHAPIGNQSRSASLEARSPPGRAPSQPERRYGDRVAVWFLLRILRHPYRYVQDAEPSSS